MSVTLEVKNHSDPPAGPCYWAFYRPEWVFIGKTFLFKSFNTIYFWKAYWKLNKNNKRVGSETGLVTTCTCSKILKKLGKIAILILVCSWKCSYCKQSNCIHWKLLTSSIKCIWNKTNLRNSWDSKALPKNSKCEFSHYAKKRSEL